MGKTKWLDNIYWCILYLILSIIIIIVLGAVKKIAGVWFSSFQILSLTIYFLQSKNLLKPFKNYFTKGQKCTSTDVGTTSIDVTTLIQQFFEFIVTFDFNNKGK